MSDTTARDRLVELVLAGKGKVSLQDLLVTLVPLARLRQVARDRGLSPKGFRVDAAPAAALAAALVRDFDPEPVQVACEALLAARRAEVPAATAPVPAAPVAASDASAEALARTEQMLQRAQEANLRDEGLIAELERRLAAEQERGAVLRGQLAALAQRPPAPDATGPDREVVRELHDARIELESFARAEEDYRRRLAEQKAELRAAEARIEELQAKVPRGKQRKTPPPPPPAERFRIPHFSAEFYRSIEGRDRRAVEAVFDAVFRLAVAGFGYPGLEVKQLGGVDLWSLRAGIKLRVYFQPRGDGDVDILAVGDREDQPTLLRRLR